MVVLLVVIAALFVWRAVSEIRTISKISDIKTNDNFVIDGDSVGVVSFEKSTCKNKVTSKSSNFQYKYYGLFLAD